MNKYTGKVTELFAEKWPYLNKFSIWVDKGNKDTIENIDGVVFCSAWERGVYTIEIDKRYNFEIVIENIRKAVTKKEEND